MFDDAEKVTHHPVIEEITNVLCKKTSNTDKSFFQVEVAYFLGKMAGCMRATLVTKDRGNIPINIYALALGSSGYGKGHSVSIMENSFIGGFKQIFCEDTMPIVAEQHIADLASKKSIKNGTDLQEEIDKLESDYLSKGAYPFTFDSGTSPAVKQLRHKLLLANAGSINLQIDEIGSNLINSVEILNPFLELYDLGSIKQKLVKNTAENIRSEEIDGNTPTNMLLFGTPVKLMDGGQTEDQFYSFLEIGYARRCIFGMGHTDRKAYYSLSPSEIYKNLTAPTNDSIIDKWSIHFAGLADIQHYGKKIEVPDDVAIKLLEYKIFCEKQADLLAEHEEVKKAELSHRYFKALKLAGAYAFIDGSLVLSMTELLQAIKLVEESGQAFDELFKRDKPYMKLAKYIASVNTEVTHADLNEALPFYKNGVGARNELMTLAIAWGYNNNIIIKKKFVDGVELFTGETLQKSDSNACILSWSTDLASGYEPEEAPFNQLDKLLLAPDLHWCNHQFLDKHRKEENALPKFNMVVLDVDGGIQISTVRDLLKDYSYIIYTTKRSTKEDNRFRVILPLDYILELDSNDYKEFMNNIFKWLPFKTDESANQRSKKWLTNPGDFYINEGKLLDALPFIPKTNRNEQFHKEYQKIESMGNLERWFAQEISKGNRNNNMIKYALALVDNGLSLQEVEGRVFSFNKQLQNPLPEDEISKTIMVTVAKRYVK